MKISNIRIISKSDGKAYLMSDFECSFSNVKELWFSVDKEYKEWLTPDVYDCFLVEAIWPAMCYHEDIEIDGNVSEILLFHIKHYLLKVIKDFRPHYRIPEIRVKGTDKASISEKRIVGTGFSGGIDSFTTIFDHFENAENEKFRINTIFFFNIGQNGNMDDPNTAVRAEARYRFAKRFTDSVGLPFIYMDSNMFRIYKPHWEYDAGPLCRIASILVFQKVCRIYYLSGSYHYLQQKDFEEYHTFDSFADSFIYYWLSTESTHIILDGGQYTRPEKTVRLKDYLPIRKYLNVCVKTDDGYISTKNCSLCHKCQRTLIVFEALGILDEFKDVFDLDLYRKHSKELIARQRLAMDTSPFIKENLIFAREHGMYIPSKLQAWLYVLPHRIKTRAKIILSFGKR